MHKSAKTALNLKLMDRFLVLTVACLSVALLGANGKKPRTEPLNFDDDYVAEVGQVDTLKTQSNIFLERFNPLSVKLSTLPRCIYRGTASKDVVPDIKEVEEMKYSDNEFNRQLIYESKYALTLLYDIGVIQLNDMDEKKQTITLTVTSSMSWRDCRLVWSIEKQNFTEFVEFGVESFREMNLFVPSVRMLEEVNPLASNGAETKARIKADGTIQISKEYKTEISCSIDVSMYPFDTQRCKMSLEVPFTQIEIHLMSDVTDRFSQDTKYSSTELLPIKRFVPSDTFEVILLPAKNTSQCVEVDDPVCKRFCDELNPICRQDRLTYLIVLRRHPTYQLVNLMFPAFIVAIISSCVFVIPPRRGDKMGLSITILLSLFVFTQLMYENMPETGSTLPLMSQFFMVCVGLVSLSCVFCAFASLLHSQNPTVPPKVAHLVALYGPYLLRDLLYVESQGKAGLAVMFDPLLFRTTSNEPSSGTASKRGKPTANQIIVNWNHVAALFDRIFFILHATACILLFMAFLLYGYIPWTQYGGALEMRPFGWDYRAWELYHANDSDVAPPAEQAKAAVDTDSHGN